MKYYIIAGEASGDLLGTYLLRALRQNDPDAQFRIWGGDGMSLEAGTPVRHIRDLAIMGFVEVVMHLRTVLGNIAFCKQDILQWQPDAVIGIDYPGFNLKIEHWAHQHGFKTIHYVSPQLWAWKKGRLKGMRQYLDRLCYILPFEQQFYVENHMPQATYVGHPLLDIVYSHSNKQSNTQSGNLIALLPGSRRQEIRRSLPYMVRLAQRHPEYHFVVAGMTLVGQDFYNKYITAASNVVVLYDQTYDILSQAHAAIVCSGTATLETALFHVPQVVCYRANPISIALAKALVGKHINHIALVDLIDNSNIVTELLQGDFNDKRLEVEFNLITQNQTYRATMLEGYRRVEEKLGGPGASLRAAQAIIDTIKI